MAIGVAVTLCLIVWAWEILTNQHGFEDPVEARRRG